MHYKVSTSRPDIDRAAAQCRSLSADSRHETTVCGKKSSFDPLATGSLQTTDEENLESMAVAAAWL